jgi:hypothetical protein
VGSNNCQVIYAYTTATAAAAALADPANATLLEAALTVANATCIPGVGLSRLFQRRFGARQALRPALTQTQEKSAWAETTHSRTFMFAGLFTIVSLAGMAAVATLRANQEEDPDILCQRPLAGLRRLGELEVHKVHKVQKATE